MFQKCRCWSGFVLASLLLMGCGTSGDRPQLGLVQGTVTLDGEPLEGVIISFKPDEGRPASATTDTAGHYELIYRYGVMGTKVGPNIVSFAWPTGASGPGIPEKYGAKTTLKEEVASGRNTFDFALVSDNPAATKAANAKRKATPKILD